MNTFQNVLHAFLESQRGKESAKLRWNRMKSTQEGYAEARAEFLKADETGEILFAELSSVLTSAKQRGELEGLLEELPEADLAQLRSLLTARGAQSMLNAEPGSFEDLLRKVRKASALWTAFKQLNRLQLVCISTGEYVTAACPPNIDAGVWNKASDSIKRKFDELRGAHPDVDIERVIAHVVHELQEAARLTYDKQSEKLVTIMQRMVESGTFDWEVSELENPELRTMARDFLSRVPMLQRQTQTKTQPRNTGVR